MPLAANHRSYYYAYERCNSLHTEKFVTPKQKAERHRVYGSDLTMHEYIIAGVVIRATNKKMAKKIYQRQMKNKSLHSQ